MEIIQEGEKREKDVKLEEEGKSPPRILNVDKALLLMILGTEPIAPTIKPRPPTEGYIRRLFGPRDGGEIFAVLLKTATEIFKLVSMAGRNVASMATPITVLAEKNGMQN